MTHSFLISIFCPDKTGLVSSITGVLYNLGINLGDTSFAVLGSGAEFTAVCDSPTNINDIETELRALSSLNDADIKITPFDLSKIHGPNALMTHYITLRGADHPGLIAQLTEVLMAFDANIVRLNAETIPNQEEKEYLINLSVSIPESRIDACLASISNTASTLAMQCHFQSV